ncbi:MAG: tRNA (adenosine(37)-N6)-threonylcarbamoyltransferase complex transferase subunit TsaD [Planctomycetota bacterium]
MERLLPMVEAALEATGLTAGDLDAVAVTNRPGLIGCLLVGLSVAKTLALSLDRPLVGVDHLEAHLFAAFQTEPELALPMLGLVASGGHTALYLVEDPTRVRKLGGTIDDAAGEALDKGAAMLGLGYPGGPAIERCAREGDAAAHRFKRGVLDREGLDVSFSGLKTALLYHLRGPGLQRELPELDARPRADLAASYQEAVVETLVAKLALAAVRHDVATVSIGGGVARNARLRELIDRDPGLAGRRLVFPPLDLCSDNAAMVAGLGAWHLARGRTDPLDLEAHARSALR